MTKDNCPKCGKGLRNQDVFKYGDNGNHKRIGKSQYCSGMKCTFDRNI